MKKDNTGCANIVAYLIIVIVIVLRKGRLIKILKHMAQSSF